MKNRRFMQGRALVIGIAAYPAPNDLPSTVSKDASDIADLLCAETFCGYEPGHVELLVDDQATGQRIREGLERLARESGPNDTALFYFSGHGFRVLSGRQAGSYLIPHDCDPARMRETAIESDELTSLFKSVAAKKFVILIDACHAGATGELKSALSSPDVEWGVDLKSYDKLADGVGRIIMASSRADETSRVLPGMNNSLFTHFLLEALKGAASIPGEDVIRVFEVFRYISDQVPARSNQQHPVFKAHNVETNFAIALHRGGTKAVGAGVATVATGSRNRPATLSGPGKIAISRQLVNRWEELATYLEIPQHEKATFEKGHEPRRILEWLEQRGRLTELRDAFNFLGWDDLIGVLENYPS